MASNRGYNSVNARSRHQLIEAAAALLGEEGYHAFSARRVAERAGLKPQLVHYYFRSMEELIVAVFLHTTEQFQARHDAAMASANPVRALWQLNQYNHITSEVTEYIALSKVFPALREEMRKAGEHFRKLQIETVTRLFDERRINDLGISSAALAVLLSAVARNFVIESESGMTGGHTELHQALEMLFEKFDPPPAAATPGSPTEKPIPTDA